MNLSLIRQIFFARRGFFIAILVMVPIIFSLYLFDTAYLEPHLASIQHEWSEKRVHAAMQGTMNAAAVYRQGNSDLAVWRERIYPKKDFARFIGDLFETASNNSIRVGTINYKPEVIKGEGLIAYSIGLNVSGRYAAIKSFIGDIERLREIAVINNISLNGKTTEESIEMKLQLTAYFRMEG